MTSAAPTEIEGLTGRVLAIIGAYSIGAAFDAHHPHAGEAPPRTRPQSVLVPGDTSIEHDATLSLRSTRV